METRVELKVNGKSLEVTPDRGYVTLDRTWQKGDEIQLELPVAPRFINANDEVKDLTGQIAITAGPVVYSLEGNKNPELQQIKIDTKSPMKISFQPQLLNGVNLITGTAVNSKSEKVEFNAIPYFAIGNIKPGDMYKVWLISQ